MSLFTEKKVENSSLAQLNLKDMAKGDSVMFYVGGFTDRTSQEYGDFKVVEGLLLDSNSSSVSALVETATGSSFIPNTMLLNMVMELKIKEGFVYRIEKAWDRGEKFSGGKTAKGHGYNVFELGVDDGTLKGLRDAFMQVKAGKETKEL